MQRPSQMFGSFAGVPRRSRRLFGLPLVCACLVAGAHGMAAQDRPREAGTSRAGFLEVIGRPRVPPDPSPPVVATAGGYREETLSFASGKDERVPLLVVRAARHEGRLPVVIALHGTGGNKEGMRGRLQRYADRGFLGIAMDARHHGARARPVAGMRDAYQGAMFEAYRSGAGHPYLYDTVWDVMRLIDYLATRDDVDASRIGIIGSSKGGTEAYLAAAADPRVAAVVSLIGVQGFGWSLRRPAGWEARIWTLRTAVEAAAALSGEPVNAAFVRKFYDRIAPGLVDRFDAPAMLPLIAPRPLMAINSDSDPRSPLGGVREAASAAARAYAAAGAPEKFELILQPDAAHEVTSDSEEAATAWLVRWLAPAGGTGAAASAR